MQVQVVANVRRQHDEQHATHHQQDVRDFVTYLLAKEEPAAEDAEQDAAAFRRHRIADEQKLQAPQVQQDSQ